MASVSAVIFLVFQLLHRNIAASSYIQNKSNIVSLYRGSCGPYTCENDEEMQKFLEEEPVLNQTGGDFCNPCTSCSCTETCQMFGTCCPDFQNDTLLYDSQCMVITFSDRSGNTFRIRTYVVTGCPTGAHIFSEACRTGTFHNTFDPRLAMTETDSGLNVLFSNRYCAICNGFSTSTVLQPKLFCIDGYKPPALPTVKDLFLWIDSTPDCDIFYSSLEGGLNLSSCSEISADLVSECNVTGLWETFDHDLEAACRLYYNPVKGTKYKNIFCYLCNGEDISGPRCSKTGDILLHKDNTFISVSFIAILNFFPPPLLSSAERSADVTPTCDMSSVYDPLEDTCKRLLCPDYQMLFGGRCQFHFLLLQHAVFHVNVLLLPNTTIAIIDHHDRQNFIERIFDKLHSRLQQTFTEMNMSLVAMRTLFRAINQQQNGYLELEAAFLDFYAESAETISIDEAYRMLVKDDLYRLDLDHGDSVISFQYSLIFGGEDLDVSVDKYPSFWGMSVNIDGVSNTLIIQLNPSDSCPLVQYEQRVFKILSNWQIQHTSTNITFNRTQYMVNDSRILLCSWHLNNIKLNQSSSHPHRHQGQIYEADGSATASSVVQFIGLVCLLLTFLTYAIFPELRTLPGKNLMLLVLSLFVAHLTFIAGAHVVDRQRACRVVGIVIHFSWLSAFAWMSVCSFHVHKVFRTVAPIVQTQDENNYLIKYCTFAFGIPFLIVFTVCMASLGVTGGKEIGYSSDRYYKSCFVSSMLVSALTFALPITISIFHNILFLVSSCMSLRKASRLRRSLQQKDMNILSHCCKLSTLTSLSWVVGFAATLSNIKVFVYMFVLLSAGQGVFLFLAFVTTRRVFRLYRGLFRRICHRERNRGNQDRHTVTLKTLA